MYKLFCLLTASFVASFPTTVLSQQGELRAKRDAEDQITFRLIESGRIKELYPHQLQSLDISIYGLIERWADIKANAAVSKRERFNLLQFYWQQCKRPRQQQTAMGEDYFQLLVDLDVPSERALVSPETIGLFEQFGSTVIDKTQTRIGFNEAIVILRDRPSDCGVLFALGQMVSSYNLSRSRIIRGAEVEQALDLERLIAACKTPIAKVKLAEMLSNSDLPKETRLDLIKKAIPHLLNDEERADIIWYCYPNVESSQPWTFDRIDDYERDRSLAVLLAYPQTKSARGAMVFALRQSSKKDIEQAKRLLERAIKPMQLTDIEVLEMQLEIVEYGNPKANAIAFLTELTNSHPGRADQIKFADMALRFSRNEPDDERMKCVERRWALRTPGEIIPGIEIGEMIALEFMKQNRWEEAIEAWKVWDNSSWCGNEPERLSKVKQTQITICLRHLPK